MSVWKQKEELWFSLKEGRQMQQLNCFLLLVNNHSQSVDYAATNNYTGAWQATPASPPKKNNNNNKTTTANRVFLLSLQMAKQILS